MATKLELDLEAEKYLLYLLSRCDSFHDFGKVRGGCSGFGKEELSEFFKDTELDRKRLFTEITKHSEIAKYREFEKDLQNTMTYNGCALVSHRSIGELSPRLTSRFDGITDYEKRIVLFYELYTPRLLTKHITHDIGAYITPEKYICYDFEQDNYAYKSEDNDEFVVCDGNIGEFQQSCIAVINLGITGKGKEGTEERASSGLYKKEGKDRNTLLHNKLKEFYSRNEIVFLIDASGISFKHLLYQAGSGKLEPYTPELYCISNQTTDWDSATKLGECREIKAPLIVTDKKDDPVERAIFGFNSLKLEKGNMIVTIDHAEKTIKYDDLGSTDVNNLKKYITGEPPESLKKLEAKHYLDIKRSGDAFQVLAVKRLNANSTGQDGGVAIKGADEEETDEDETDDEATVKEEIYIPPAGIGKDFTPTGVAAISAGPAATQGQQPLPNIPLQGLAVTEKRPSPLPKTVHILVTNDHLAFLKARLNRVPAIFSLISYNTSQRLLYVYKPEPGNPEEFLMQRYDNLRKEFEKVNPNTNPVFPAADEFIGSTLENLGITDNKPLYDVLNLMKTEKNLLPEFLNLFKTKLLGMFTNPGERITNLITMMNQAIPGTPGTTKIVTGKKMPLSDLVKETMIALSDENVKNKLLRLSSSPYNTKVKEYFGSLEDKIILSITYTYVTELYARLTYFIHTTKETLVPYKERYEQIATDLSKLKTGDQAEMRKLIIDMTQFIDQYKHHVRFITKQENINVLDVNIKIYHEYFAKIKEICWKHFTQKPITGLDDKNFVYNLNLHLNVGISKVIESFTQTIINSLPFHVRKTEDEFLNMLKIQLDLDTIIKGIHSKAKTVTSGGGSGHSSDEESSDESGDEDEPISGSQPPIDGSQPPIFGSQEPDQLPRQHSLLPSAPASTSSPSQDIDPYPYTENGEEEDDEPQKVPIDFEDLYPESKGHADPILAAIFDLPYDNWTYNELLRFMFLRDPSWIYISNFAIIDDNYGGPSSAAAMASPPGGPYPPMGTAVAEGGKNIKWSLEDYHRKYYPPYIKLYYS